MKVTIEKLPRSAVKINVVVENEKVKQTYEEILNDVVRNAELPGFRKGLAPKEIVKEKTDVSKLYGEIINKLLQTYYSQAIKENLIKPIANPRVEIKEFDIEKDFEFTATVALLPEITIGEYKEKLAKHYLDKIAKSREENAKKLKEGEKLEETHTHITPNEVIDIILEASSLQIADLLVEDETERMMSRLVDRAQSIGLSLDQYLKAQNKTAEQLKKDYEIAAEKNLKAEFVLSQVAKDEKIEISDKEIEDAVSASGNADASAKLNDPVEKWYIKSILEKNKLISNLIDLAQEKGGHTHAK